MRPKPVKRAAQIASAPRGFDKELAELETLAESLRTGPASDQAQIERIRKALGHRNNFLVAKAAKLATELELAGLLPEVLAAYDRFFIDPVKSDPQCWAKNALVKALVKLEYRSKDAYLRGLRHHQLEPVWGGSSDTAGALRCACTHALVDCPGLSDAELLTHLVSALTDTDKTVRVEAARAIGGVGGVSAALLLRLRALIGPVPPDHEAPEVLGAVYSSLLAVEGAPAIPLVVKALEGGDDLAAEAAFALADQRKAEILAPLLTRHRAGADTWFTGVLLSAIALTRLPQAFDYLLALIASDARDAPAAIESIGRIGPNSELRARIEQAVEQADSSRLRQALREHLPAQ
jgi:HEAT repeat protein